MPKRQHTDVRRRQIADAALEVIATQGLGRFTTQAIAARVGVTDGTLFRHFSDKEEIVRAALDRVEEALFEGFPPDHPDPVVRLERFFRARVALIGARPVIARLAFSEDLPHAAGAAGAEQVEGWKRRTFSFVEACVGEAASQGRLRPGLPVREVGLVVVGTILALGRLEPLVGGTHEAEGAWRVLVSFFLEVPS